MARCGVRAWLLASALTWAACGAVRAQSAADSSLSPSQDSPQTFAFHVQATVLEQANLAFKAPYAGPDSLPANAVGRETADLTLFAGVRPWKGAEIWINPEIDQGFGLGGTLGVAGFPSGEAYKVGASDPYFKLQRLFFRQTIDLGGERQSVDADQNQLAGWQTADRLVLTFGKVSVVDIFDNNDYAHDPKGDFMNWALVDTGTFDYAADAWGYSVGGAAELYVGAWTFRGGVFNLSVQPNSAALEYNFSQFQVDGEAEARFNLGKRAGKLKLTWFLTRGRMGRFSDAIALARQTDQPADIALVRRYQSRQGVSLNLQQEVADGLGVFVRAGLADGSLEPYEFADIDQTGAVGMALKGARWSRADDTLGVALLVNAISKRHQQYLDDGGTGILVGDGKLPHAGLEQILETYYNIAVVKHLNLTFDYQFVENPAYNRDRGPVSIFAARLHTAF